MSARELLELYAAVRRQLQVPATTAEQAAALFAFCNQLEGSQPPLAPTASEAAGLAREVEGVGGLLCRLASSIPPALAAAQRQRGSSRRSAVLALLQQHDPEAEARLAAAALAPPAAVEWLHAVVDCMPLGLPADIDVRPGVSLLAGMLNWPGHTALQQAVASDVPLLLHAAGLAAPEPEPEHSSMIELSVASALHYSASVLSSPAMRPAVEEHAHGRNGRRTLQAAAEQLAAVCTVTAAREAPEGDADEGSTPQGRCARLQLLATLVAATAHSTGPEQSIAAAVQLEAALPAAASVFSACLQAAQDVGRTANALRSC
ncbi:hypothetical protein ABPG75_007400 [Micractinium tetrahymenae]